MYFQHELDCIWDCVLECIPSLKKLSIYTVGGAGAAALGAWVTIGQKIEIPDLVFLFNGILHQSLLIMISFSCVSGLCFIIETSLQPSQKTYRTENKGKLVIRDILFRFITIIVIVLIPYISTFIWISSIPQNMSSVLNVRLYPCASHLIAKERDANYRPARWSEDFLCDEPVMMSRARKKI